MKQERQKVLFMELHLFGPVPDNLLKEVYGVTLSKVKAGDKSTCLQMRRYRLEGELARIGVDAKKIPGIHMSESSEKELSKKIAACYNPHVAKMSWSELIMNYTKLTQYGFIDAADVIWAEMNRREGIEASEPSEDVVDPFCKIGAAI